MSWPRRRNFRAYTCMDPAAGYEVFALVPGLTADEVCRGGSTGCVSSAWPAERCVCTHGRVVCKQDVLTVLWPKVQTGQLPTLQGHFSFLFPCTAAQVSVRCWSSGVVLIEGEPVNPPSGPGAPAPLSEHVQLPTRIDTRSAVAQVGWVVYEGCTGARLR